MSASRALRRWLVHLALIVTACASLAFEFVLTIHVLLGLAFVTLAGAHLAQRRRTSMNLARRLKRLDVFSRRGGRLAISDTVLLALTIGMLVSGFVDLGIGHPTRIRWHALSGVALAIYLAVHTLRRRSRLRTSQVR